MGGRGGGPGSAREQGLSLTGLDELSKQPTGIVGIYSDPKHVIFYTSNGEARQEFSIVLTAPPLGGQPTPSSESSEVRWVPESELPGYTMDRSMRIRINSWHATNPR